MYIYVCAHVFDAKQYPIAGRRTTKTWTWTTLVWIQCKYPEVNMFLILYIYLAYTQLIAIGKFPRGMQRSPWTVDVLEPTQSPVEKINYAQHYSNYPHRLHLLHSGTCTIMHIFTLQGGPLF